jgi:hypothetical protein
VLRPSGVAVVLLSLTLAACGGGSADAPPRDDRTGWPGIDGEPADTEDIDPFDPAYSLAPESDAAERRLLRRLGRREDFRVPRDAVEDLPDGALARAVVARMWHELALPGRRYERLNDGQRALFAMQTADAEILDGGFDALWSSPSGVVARDLVAAAERVGAREHARIFADAARLFPGGRIPRDRAARERIGLSAPEQAVAALDERYAATQYRRRTLLAPILARYVRAHPREFFAG